MAHHITRFGTATHALVGIGILGALVATGNRVVADLPTQPAAKGAAKNEPPTDANSAADEDETESTPRVVRVPPRPERTPEERQRLIAELRQAYNRPPSEWPAPHVDEGVEWKELGLLPEVEHPESNPYSIEKAELGKTLFFDPRLSGSGQIACAPYDPDLAWADGRTVAFGHSRQPLKRNAPTVMNTAFYESLFWDGRAGSLEDQASQVLLNPQEMRAREADLLERLEKVPAYREMFRAAFDSDEITFDRVSKALATYERTIVGGRSRFDAFLRGKTEVLSDEALIGLDFFRREARCLNCHHGPHLSDSKFHDVGLSYYGRKYEDLGRYTVTGEAADVGKFRTPSLRNISSTAPYMHNGLFPLPGVLNMYNAGMPTLRRKDFQAEDPLFPTKSPLLKPLRLNRQDLRDLLIFLDALTEPRLRVRPPELPGLTDGETPHRINATDAVSEAVEAPRPE